MKKSIYVFDSKLIEIINYKNDDYLCNFDNNKVALVSCEYAAEVFQVDLRSNVGIAGGQFGTNVDSRIVVYVYAVGCSFVWVCIVEVYRHSVVFGKEYVLLVFKRLHAAWIVAACIPVELDGRSRRNVRAC